MHLQVRGASCQVLRYNEDIVPEVLMHLQVRGASCLSAFVLEQTCGMS